MGNSRTKINWYREIKILIFNLIISASVLFLIISNVAQAYRVEGKSMEPALQDEERVIVSKITYKFKEIKRGDIVIFRYPLQPDKYFIKRVIGLPNERIRIKNGEVYINNKRLQEPYLKKELKSKGNFFPTVIPQGYFFVLGDHRTWSNDSRNGWLVPRKNIVGKAVFRYWPFRRMGMIK